MSADWLRNDKGSTLALIFVADACHLRQLTSQPNQTFSMEFTESVRMMVWELFV